ncbi:MAG: WD40 repeat domain-containing protein [Pseudolabrys sp.]
MSDTSSPLPSLADRAKRIETGAPVVGVHFFGRTPVFVLGEEALLYVRGEDEQRVAIHGGAILASASDGTRIVTGGDDGKLIATDIDGEHEVLATDDKRRWIDQVALGPDQSVAWSASKVAHALTKKGEARNFEAPSTVAGLCFAPKGFRLAVAHYNGATLWFPNAEGAKPQTFEWKGSHLGVTISPDGKYLMTTMQEQTLHGWRIADGKNMRMSGYSTRVRSLGWTSDGAFLSPPRVPSSSFSGHSTARTGPWVNSRRRWRPRRRASRRLPAIRASRWWPRATATAQSSWCGSTTAP